MNKNTFLSVIWLLLVALAVAGCGEAIGSNSVTTDGVYAEFTANAEGDGQTDIQARLKTGGPNSNTFLRLEDGDELTFYVDGEDYEPNEETLLDERTYYQKWVDADAGGTNMRIAFTRENGIDAPNSTATMPREFEITSPDSGHSYSRSQNEDVLVQLTNSDSSRSQLRATVRGDCLEGSYSTTASGQQDTITIPGEELESETTDDDAPSTCTPSVTVERTREGDVDSVYEGGSFEATQERVTSFESTP